MRLHIAVSLLVVSAVPGLVSAQSLASLAQGARRARAGPAAKVYTEADLRAARGRVSVGVSEAAEQPALEPAFDPLFDAGGLGEAGPLAPTAEEMRSQRRAELQKKVDEQNGIVTAVRQAMEAAQSELNDLTQLTFGARRAYLVQIVEDGQRELAKARQAVADLEDQARRDGFFLSR
jgi:hypothetical protein